MSLLQSKTDDLLEKEIAYQLSKLEGLRPDDPVYLATLKNVDALQQIRSHTSKDRISRDALLTVGANLLGIVAILSFERTHVIASKALTFVSKTRL